MARKRDSFNVTDRGAALSETLSQSCAGDADGDEDVAAWMKEEEYKQLVEVLGRTIRAHAHPDYDDILRTHPSVSLDCVRSIFMQEATRYLKTKEAAFRRAQRVAYRRQGDECLRRYQAGEDALELSRALDIPPSRLMRMVVEGTVQLSRKAVAAVMRDPSSLRLLAQPAAGGAQPGSPGAPAAAPAAAAAAASELPSAHFGGISVERLIWDLERSSAVDPLCSPHIDAARAAAGAAFERILADHLGAARVPFQSEERLRALQFAKTPDAHLEVPILVHGRAVHWIDSKASFGDPQVHREQGMRQFLAYVNRYGPGLVIYWMGFVEELNSHPEILILDEWPPEDAIQRMLL